MDSANPPPKNAAPGVSIRNGPILEMEIDGPVVNGTEINGNAGGKRKARSSTGQQKSYKEASDEEDEKPLVNKYV
jgi:DNA topoisomerase-1